MREIHLLSECEIDDLRRYLPMATFRSLVEMLADLDARLSVLDNPSYLENAKSLHEKSLEEAKHGLRDTLARLLS